MIEAILDGTTKVLILHFEIGVPQDQSEILVIYSNYDTGVISWAYSEDDSVLDRFCVCE